MATFTSETVTRTVHRWIVPAAEPWGACLGDLRAAIQAAGVAYRDAHGLPKSEELRDDALRFHVGDEAIVIEFTTEEPAS